MLKLLAIAALAVFLLMAVCVGVLVVAIGEDESATSAANPPANATPIALSAAQLLDAYETNEVAAKAQYEDKFLEVTGVVAEVSESFGQHSLKLEPGSGFSFASVRCSFEEEYVGQLLTLQKGQTVTVRGFGDGLGFIDVDVRECRVVSPS